MTPEIRKLLDAYVTRVEYRVATASDPSWDSPTRMLRERLDREIDREIDGERAARVELERAITEYGFATARETSHGIAQGRKADREWVEPS